MGMLKRVVNQLVDELEQDDPLDITLATLNNRLRCGLFSITDIADTTVCSIDLASRAFGQLYE